MKNTDHIFDQILQACEALEGTLNQRLDVALAAHPEAAALRPDLKAALWLQLQRDVVAPRPGFVNASRGRVLSRIRQEQAGRVSETRSKPKFRLWPAKAALRMAVVAVVILGILLSSTGVAYASQGSLPGETLYGVKIAVEDVQLGVSRTDVKDASLHADFAGTRLDEIGALLQNESLDYIGSTVDNLEEHVNAVAGLVQTAPDTDKPAITEIANGLERTLDEKGQQMAALQTGLSAETQVAMGGVLDSVAQGITTLRTATGTESEPTPETELPTNTPEPTPTVTVTPEATSTETVEVSPTPVQTETPIVEVTPSFTPAVVDPGDTQVTVPDGSSDPADDKKDKTDKEDKDDNPDDGNNGSGNDDKVYNPNKPPKDK